METKKCKECGVEKPLSEFGTENTLKSKKRAVCKTCRAEYQLRHSRTKIGVVHTIYFSQLSSSRGRDYPAPDYTKEDLETWAFSQPLFHELYDKWVESGYNKWLKPSVDRIDDYKGYTMDNIQLMTWRENNKKSHYDKIHGINTKSCKSVLQYDLSGNLVKEYYSTRKAGDTIGVNYQYICDICNNHSNIYKGYKWVFKNSTKMKKEFDLQKSLDKIKDVLGFNNKDEYKIAYFSGYKPTSYFVPQMVFSTKQALEYEPNGKLSWFCEIFVNGRCVFRECYTDATNKKTDAEIEQLCFQQLIDSLIVHAVGTSMNALLQIDKERSENW